MRTTQLFPGWKFIFFINWASEETCANVLALRSYGIVEFRGEGMRIPGEGSLWLCWHCPPSSILCNFSVLHSRYNVPPFFGFYLLLYSQYFINFSSRLSAASQIGCSICKMGNSIFSLVEIMVIYYGGSIIKWHLPKPRPPPLKIHIKFRWFHTKKKSLTQKIICFNFI